MCGISGFLDTRGANAEALDIVARGMADTIAHRGPDDADTWTDPEAGVAFGHRRLSIIDLSEHGHQPMESHTGRYVVVYNGELYNFRSVRDELARLGQYFRGHSDTEVLLAAVERWGLVAALRRFTGMFAFALWDRRDRRLHLARDRMGEKPLYYGWQNGVFLFGSELKALRSHPAWNAPLDKDALTLYLRFGYVPAPWSIYRDIRKLRQGCTLTVNAVGPGVIPEPEPYWSHEQAALHGAHHPFEAGDSEAVAKLRELLSSAVGEQMVADVPLGAFLSGGVDSSLIVALMQAQSARPVRTFTIGFHEQGYNEAEHAAAVAAHLGTDHTELYVTPREAMDVVPLLPRMYDEPFADSSQIPTHLVSRLARQHVTVSLSGDGGDELFGGYTRYFAGPRLWRHLRHVPRTVRSAAGALIDSVGVQRWDSLADLVRRAGGSRTLPPRLGSRMGKLAAVLRFGGPELIHRALVSAFDSPGELLIQSTEPHTLLDDRARWPRLQGFTEQMMYVDALTYLPDDILVKVDRASMACSLESRAPYLDHRVVEFAWALPLHMRIRGSTSKWILRQLLYEHVPPELIERPKAGFAIPVAAWLRGSLRDWAAELLNERRLASQGLFRPAAVRRLWDEHQSGRYDRQFPLWALLMFQAWLEVSPAQHSAAGAAA